MISITYRDKEYSVQGNSSVLDTLEAAGIHINSSCRNGVCQTCKMKNIRGTLPARAQEGLTSTEREAGYFLPCVCYPTDNIVIADGDKAPQYDASVISVTSLAYNIIEVKLTHPPGFEYKPGQYIQVFKDTHHVRTYSLASVPAKNEPLTLHVRVIPDGVISPWLQSLSAGQNITIAGPFGKCFYMPDKKDQPIMMIGTGSGLSPLYGILHDALLNQHMGDIYLFHGVAERKSIYKENRLRKLSEKFPQFHYFPCLSNEQADPYESGMVLDVALKKIPSTKGMRIFLCGHPEMIKSASRKIYLAGANMSDIHIDPFG